MPAAPISLDGLTPDLVFVFDDVEYRLSGDPPVETLLELKHLSEQIEDTTASADLVSERVIEIIRDLFGLERLPFGVLACQKVVEALVESVNEAMAASKVPAPRPRTPRAPRARR